MSLIEIPYQKLRVNPHNLFENRWLVLTCGDLSRNDYNGMTIAWGSLGTMWHRPFVQVVVRPTRYTFEFMNQYDQFTVCAFPESRKDALQVMGSRSGRDCDKISEAGLTPVPSGKVASPAYEEAELVIECRKIYFDDMTPQGFVDPEIERNYPKKDYHGIYFGEVLMIRGREKYLSG